jgi:hypothetical protein
MQAKDPQNAPGRARSFPATSSTAFARFSSSKHLQDRPQRHRRATSKGFWIAEASCAQSQGADYHGQTIQTPLPLLPSKRPSVAVCLAPLLRRLLEIHYHNSTSLPTSINTPPTSRIPRTCPTRSPLPLPPTRSLLPPNRRHKPRMRLWDLPQDRPSRRNRVTT